jgi:hypothetical protein
MRRINQRSKWLLPIIIACILFVSPPGRLAIAQARDKTSAAQQDSLNFLWNFAGASRVKSGVKVSFFNGNITLRTGTSLKFFFVPTSLCYIYLFVQTSQGKIELLIPSDEKEIGKPVEPNKMLTYPGADGWTGLDTVTGKETFYFLVSGSPLSSIEDAYLKMNSSPSNSSRSREKLFASNMRSMLKKSLMRHVVIAVNPAEMGGSVRGFRETLPVNPKEIDFQRVVTSDLFAKKIVIEHIR